MDDPPLSNVNAPRPASDPSGDGANPEPSDLPASGESRACRFPFLTSARDSFACLMWNSRIWSFESARRSALLVSGFEGIILHLSFLPLHRRHGPSSGRSQSASASMHRSHCNLLALSRLRVQWHTQIMTSSSEPCSNGLPLLPPEPCLAGSGCCLDWAWCFAAPCGTTDDPFRFLVVAVTLEVLGLPRP